jgi:putative transposase
MKDLLFLAVHLITTIAKLMGPGGAKAIVAQSLFMKQQLLVVNRSRQRAPNLSALDRFLFGFWSLVLNPRRISRFAVIIKPSTLQRFHKALVKCKYQWLYSSRKNGKPGPKGPSPELIQAMALHFVACLTKQSREWGYPSISVPTMIRSSNIIAGKRTYESWRSMR